MKRFFVVIVLYIWCQTVCAFCLKPCRLDECYPTWSALLYYGKMTNDNLGNVVAFDFSTNSDTLYSLELGKQLNPCNPVRLFFQPIVSSVDIRWNVTFLDDRYGTIYEINPYLALNWYHFPWCHKLRTVISFGEGVSYVSKVPYAEAQNSDQPKKFLNFLLGEIAIALPCHPEWELIARIHHRSGAYGLYHANNSGSTAVGIAIRYRFN